MRFLVPASFNRQNNVIIRPHQPAAVVLQLDDLTASSLERVRPFAFMIVATSPGNFQTWLAVDAESISDRKDFARRVRKATGADPSASGASRIAGTANYKRKYEPDFPVIAVELAQPGRTVAPAALEAAGLIAAPEKATTPAAPRIIPRRRNSKGGKWPSYQYCVDHAPNTHGADRPDISRADFHFLHDRHRLGLQRGSYSGVADGRKRQGQENGQTYATETARNAAAAVHRRRAAPEP